MNPVRSVETLILNLRGQKVLMDADLAAIYGVPTKALNQAVKRNADRFPEDFCFQLSSEEWSELNRSQIVTGPRNTVIRDSCHGFSPNTVRSWPPTSSTARMPSA